MTLRRKLTAEEQATVAQQEQRERTAQQRREKVARFRDTFSLPVLQDRLPLRFPTTHRNPESRPFWARSWYTYPGWAALTDAQYLAVLTPFYMALHLIDFTPLRTELVALTGIHLNAPGETPFDPVSLFLCCLLRWEKGLGWRALAQLLAGPEGACWRRLLGFTAGATPAASTMRGFYHDLGTAFDTDLCPRFIALLQAAGLLPPHSTHEATPPEQGVPLAVDGMLHEAHSTRRCSQVTARCYEPTSPDHPQPCPAQEAGLEGCACTTEACAAACRLTTPRDPAARFIHYSGRNQDGAAAANGGRDVYGYRSYTQNLCHDELHVSWVAHTSVQPANADERVIFPTDFAQLRQRLPQIRIGTVVGDAALGYQECLDTIYAARAIPVITIRRHECDADETACLLRGYDGNGHLLCAHGHPMSFNGVDYQRLRATWVCRQVCQRTTPARPVDATCPFRNPQQPLGQVRHVGSAFIHPDGSRHTRLARLFPYGSPLWKSHAASRHNAAEGRNSQIMRLGLKRLWSYGLTGATADITFADLLINLRTLGRLVQEATLLVDAD
jgi:hypothetical protein